MRKKSWMRIGVAMLVVFFTLSVTGADLAFAKGGGGGGSRSSSSFSGGSRSSGSSSSFGGGSRSSAPSSKPSGGGWFGGGSKAAPAAPAAKPSSGFGGGSKADKATTAPKASVPASASSKSTQTRMQQVQSRKVTKAESAKALNDLKAEKSKFKGQPSTAATPASTQSAVMGKVGRNSSGTTITRNNYYVQRDSYYGGWNRPAYAYNYSSSFGMWDGLFLWMMIDQIGDANRHDAEMYYHHQNDPGMQEWRANAEKEAANNADLKAKLAALDQKVKTMEAQGVKRDESFVPDGAGAAVLAPEVAEKALPEQTPEDFKAAEAQGGYSWFFWFVILGGGAALTLVVIAMFKPSNY